MNNCRMDKRDLADIVVTAFEGGISYWAESVNTVELNDSGEYENMPEWEHKSYQIDGVGPYDNVEFWKGKARGYEIEVYEEDDPVGVLTIAGLRAAFDNEYYADEAGKKIAKRLNNPGDYDADDADVLVQIAVFGEVVYG